jgi:general secretion pathway protein G
MRRPTDPGSRSAAAQRGFTLIELLVVVAIIAIVAAISIPNLLNATQKSRQSSTLADMRTVSSVLERYATDNGRYPEVADIRAVVPLVEPDYIGRLPVSDAWGGALVYEVAEEGRSYVLRSLGSDGTAEEGEPRGATHEHAADIVCANGSFLQWPVGRQR